MQTLFDSRLRPDYIMPFGLNKGHSLAEIYQYNPFYLQWLIANIETFEISIEDFEILPKPTIYAAALGSIKPCGDVRSIRNCRTLKEIDFTFSKEVREILSQKNLGIYKPSGSYRISFSFSGETIFDLLQYKLPFEYR